MSEQIPGLELFLTSEKAVAGAAKFREAVESAAAAVERIGTAVDKLDAVLDRMGTASTKAGESTKKLGDQAVKSGDAMKRGADGAQQFDQKVGRLGITAGSVTRQLTLMLGAAGAISGLGAAVAAFSDYEDKLRILGSIANATGLQLQKLENAATDLSRNTRFTPREALQGLTELSRAGLSAQDSITALKPTADLARVGLLSLSDSSAIVTKTLTQFALGADQASRVADVLAKAANSSNADVGTLADSLAKTGPVARQFGVSLEDTVAALAKLADNGLAANISGTGLQRVLIQLRSPTEEAQRALLGLGLTAEKINPEKVGLIGALQNLRAANISVQDSVSLVGTEFASLLTILTSSVSGIDQVGAALRDSTGEAAKQAAAGADTLAAAFADLRGASEQFAVSSARGGIGQVLTEITRTGAEVLRVLAGDKKAMEEAGVASKLLATGLQLATVAGAAFAGAKLAGVIAGVATSLKQATAATVLYEAATGLAVGRVSGATRAFGALTAVLRANPFVAVASAIAGVVTAMSVFGSRSDDTAADLQKQRDEAKHLEEQYRDLAKAIADATRAPGEFSNRDTQADGIRRTREEALKFARELEQMKEGQRVPLQGILSLAGLDQEAARIKLFQDQLESLRASARQTADEVRQGVLAQPWSFTRQTEANQKAAAAYQAAMQQIAEAERQLGIETDESGRKTYDLAKAMDVVRRVLGRTEEQAIDAGIALAKIGQANTGDVSSAVRALVAERERELEIAKLSGEERERALLFAEAEKRAGQGLNAVEKEKLGLLAKAIVDGEKRVEQQHKERQEAEKLAEQQRELPQAMADLQKRYEDQLALAQATGEQRELLRATIDAENEAKAIGLRLDSQQFQTILALAQERARLAFAEGQQRRDSRIDRRQDEAFRRLQDEEELLKRVGQERLRYERRIQAEQEARQAGLAIGSEEYNDYVKRKTALNELSAAQEQMGQLGSQFASAWTSALEQFIIDGGRARDVARALWQDLQRMAFRQTIGQGLNSLFVAGGQALAGAFGGGRVDQPGSGGPAFSSPGPSQTSADYRVPFQLGGVIPAMGGTVIDQLSFLQRGDKTYSISEGSKVTPEAIFPLERDARGRLGIAAVGGGGDTINMSFPAVRTAHDAKAMRATFGQQVRALRAGDRRGRRGRRPAGE